jgi:hypothetical protein
MGLSGYNAVIRENHNVGFKKDKKKARDKPWPSHYDSMN